MPIGLGGRVTYCSEAADADLLDERKQVDEWWDSLLNEAAAWRQQIDNDKQQALDNIDFADASKMAQTRKAAGALETGMDAVAVEATDTTDAAAENPQHSSNARAAAVTIGSSRPQQRAPEEAPASELETPSDYESAEADAFPSATAQRKHSATTPPFSAGANAHVTREEATRHLAASPVRTPDEPDTLHIDGGFMTSTDLTTLVSEVESRPPSHYEPAENAGSPYIHSDSEVALVVQKRSGSPDSVSSDFVEI